MDKTSQSQRKWNKHAKGMQRNVWAWEVGLDLDLDLDLLWQPSWSLLLFEELLSGDLDLDFAFAAFSQKDCH